VIGNCASYYKETETAIKAFQRAIQLSPQFTYAYTLCGHEYVSHEDIEKAISYFQRALSCTPSHYQAYYGLGKSTIYSILYTLY
jgi:anaphase-promoting complex subunit 3